MPKFLNQIVAPNTIDMVRSEVQNLRIQNLATAPNSGSELKGQFYFDTVANRLYYWNGTAWIAADGGTIAYGNVTAETTFGASSANGVAATASHSDHLHGNPAHTSTQHVIGTEITVVSPAIILGTAAAAGSAASLIRSDSTIVAFDATAPTTSAPGDAAAVGSIAFAARRDHTHGREQIMWKNPVRAATSAAGTLASSFANTSVIDGVTLATGDRILIKDQATGSENGIYLVAASGAPTRTTDADTSAEVTSGLAVTVSEGTVNADTAWVLATNGTITLNTTSLTFSPIGSSPGTPGSSAVGDSVNAGAAVTYARSDHRHGREAFATNGITLATAASAGSATTLIRSDAAIAAFDATTPTTSALADAAATGSVAFAARRDHVHGRESFGGAPGTTEAIGTVGAAGSATTPSRSDHVHPMSAAAAPAASAVGDTVVTGAATTFAASDHKHAREAFATNTVALGTAAAAGSATTLIRSDATIAAFDATVPTTSAPGDAAATGSVAFSARRDHVHGREVSTAKTAVRATTTTNGTLASAYANGSAIDGVTLATSDRILIKDQTTQSENGIYVVAASGAPTRSTDADTGAELSAATVVVVAEGTANADTMWELTNNGTITLGSTNLVFSQIAGLVGGTASTSAVGDSATNGTAVTVARSDHKHAREAFSGSTASGTTFGTANANGSATTLSHSDHQHGTPTHIAADHSAIHLNDLATATGAYNMGGFAITNMATPTNPGDAATKGYVDGVATGLDVKASVKIASTANFGATYNATGGTSGRGQFTAASNANIDGVALVANDRVLLKNQTTPAQNGVYVVTTVGSGANGVWDRATDFDQDAEVTDGAFVFVEQGTANADTGWVLTTNNPITIGGGSGTSLTWAQFSGAGTYTWGTGISATGATINVGAGAATGSGGPGGGLVANADDLVIDTAVVVRKFAADVGDGSTLNYVITHSLGTRDVTVAVRDNSSPWAFMFPDIEATSTTTATLRFTVAPTSNQYRVIIHA